LKHSEQTSESTVANRRSQSGSSSRASDVDLRKLARDVLTKEGNSVLALRDHIDQAFVDACNAILQCQGRIVVCGIGKSGHIANKIAATLASTGTAAFFVHAAEASHGDLGMIRRDDVVIAISYSGESDELKNMLPTMRHMGNILITLTGNPNSSLASAATFNIDVSVDIEACPLGLAPTSSTTATLAMGDALAIAILQKRGFSADDFALTHPAGALGKRLLLHVADVMASGPDVPQVLQDETLKDALYVMNAGKLGFLVIVDDAQMLLGVFSDGDLRRALECNPDLNSTSIGDVMTPGGQTIGINDLAVDALRKMEQHQIYALPVLDENNKVCGALNMHSLFRAGVV
jgi:arabinose-5-phosphate isomerase